MSWSHGVGRSAEHLVARSSARISVPYSRASIINHVNFRRLPSVPTQGVCMRLTRSFFGLLFLTAGCHSDARSSAPESAIVQQVQAAGAGNLDQTDAGSLQIWFAQHIAVARSILPMCAKASQSAPASWATTTEGKSCLSAKNASFMAPSGTFDRYTAPPRVDPLAKQH